MHFLLSFLVILWCRSSDALTSTKINYLPNGQVGGYELIINNTVEARVNSPLPRDGVSKIVKQTSRFGSTFTRVDEQVIGENSYLNVHSILMEQQKLKQQPVKMEYPLKTVLMVQGVRYLKGVPENVKLRFAQIGPYAALIVPTTRLESSGNPEYPVPPEIRDSVKTYIEVQEPPSSTPSSQTAKTGYAYAPSTYKNPPSPGFVSPSTTSNVDLQEPQEIGSNAYPEAARQSDTVSGPVEIENAGNDGFVLRVLNPAKGDPSSPVSGNEYQEFFVPARADQLDRDGDDIMIANPLKYSGSTNPSTSQFTEVYNKDNPSLGSADSLNDRTSNESLANQVHEQSASDLTDLATATNKSTNSYYPESSPIPAEIDDDQEKDSLNGQFQSGWSLVESKDPEIWYNPFEGPPPGQPEFSDVSPDMKKSDEPGSDLEIDVRIPVFEESLRSMDLSAADEPGGQPEFSDVSPDSDVKKYHGPAPALEIGVPFPDFGDSSRTDSLDLSTTNQQLGSPLGRAPEGGKATDGTASTSASIEPKLIEFGPSVIPDAGMIPNDDLGEASSTHPFNQFQNFEFRQPKNSVKTFKTTDSTQRFQGTSDESKNTFPNEEPEFNDFIGESSPHHGENPPLLLTDKSPAGTADSVHTSVRVQENISEKSPDISHANDRQNPGKFTNDGLTSAISGSEQQLKQSPIQKDPVFNGRGGNRYIAWTPNGGPGNLQLFDNEKFKKFIESPSLTTQLRFVSPDGQTTAILTSTGSSAKVELPSTASQTSNLKGDIVIPQTVVPFPISGGPIEYKDGGPVVSSDYNQRGTTSPLGRSQYNLNEGLQNVQNGNVVAAVASDNKYITQSDPSEKHQTNQFSLLDPEGRNYFERVSGLRGPTPGQPSSANLKIGGTAAASENDQRLQSFNTGVSSLGRESAPKAEFTGSDTRLGTQSPPSQLQPFLKGGTIANQNFPSQFYKEDSSSEKAGYTAEELVGQSQINFVPAPGSRQDAALFSNPNGRTVIENIPAPPKKYVQHVEITVPHYLTSLPNRAKIPVDLQAETVANQDSSNAFRGKTVGFDPTSAAAAAAAAVAAGNEHFKQFDQAVSPGTTQASTSDSVNLKYQQFEGRGPSSDQLAAAAAEADARANANLQRLSNSNRAGSSAEYRDQIRKEGSLDEQDEIPDAQFRYASQYGRYLTPNLQDSQQPGVRRTLVNLPCSNSGPHTEGLLEALNGLVTVPKRQ